MAFVVDAIDGILRAWTGAHVGQEIGEGVSPTVTDRDAATTVIGVTGGCWHKAALAHGNPRLKFRSSRTVVGWASSFAAATFGATQIARIDVDLSAAVAHATPSWPPSIVDALVLQGRDLAEPLAGSIDEFHTSNFTARMSRVAA